MKKTYLIFGLLFIIMLFSGIVSAVSPVLSNEIPTDESTLIEITITSVNVTITDIDTDFNWSIDFTPDIGNSSGTLAKNGSKTCSISGLLYGTTYTWVITTLDSNSTEGSGNFTNATYTFTTRSEERLTEHFTDPTKLLVIGLLSTFLLLGLVAQTVKMFKEKTFTIEKFFVLFFMVVVIIITVSLI